MSRQLEQHVEDRSRRRHLAIVAAVEYELVEAVSYAGGQLHGFSVKLSGGDCLITLRLNLAGKEQISFVGGADLGSCLIKAVRLARADELKYRPSKF